MADPNDTTQEIQAQVLDGIRKSQEAVIEGMRTWAETVQQLVPGAQSALPRSSQLPSATEVVDSVFDFAAQLLNAQRELAHSVLGATTEIGERAQDAATASADAAAKKPVKS
jgi:methyl-accepting chemotaxis protein